MIIVHYALRIMHYIKPVRVTLACLNILLCVCIWAGMATAVPAFFFVYPTPAHPLKGAGSCDDDDDNDDGG